MIGAAPTRQGPQVSRTAFPKVVRCRAAYIAVWQVRSVRSVRSNGSQRPALNNAGPHRQFVGGIEDHHGRPASNGHAHFPDNPEQGEASMDFVRSNVTSRRAVLKALASGAAAPLSGCSLFEPRHAVPVCPTSALVSYPAGPLTIDAHCHVFNGTDLQVKEFFRRVAVHQGGFLGFLANSLGDLLQALAWEHAPSGDEELKVLSEISTALKTCSEQGHAQRLAEWKQDGYARGREQLQLALAKSPQLMSLKANRAAMASSLDAQSTDAARIEALSLIESLPERAADYEALRSAKALRGETHSGLKASMATRSVSGLVSFVLQNFQYRYVSVHDYLGTFNRPGQRVVDLMMPSMVDYDYWLNQGRATPTSLETQVEVMRQISILTNGRVHAFVPYDPLRQVAYDLGHSLVDSLSLVMRAVEEDGFIGVKLYPPMGFAALGNHEKDGEKFWARKWLPPWTDRPDLGKLLDGSMRQLLQWCKKHQVPVMAHTSASNGPTKEYEALAGPEYWKKALGDYGDLRISFGHFGGSSPAASGSERARQFADLMAGSGMPGSNAYADAGYFLEVISQEPKLEAVLRQLYEVTSSRGDAALVNRFMYGTDWEMTLVEGPVDSYLEQFQALLSDLEQQPAIKSQGHTDLAARFFGMNAARWAGLEAGGEARKRLDNFYGKYGVEPDWRAKVDNFRARSPMA